MSSHLAQELVSVIRINSRVLEAGYEKHLWVGRTLAEDLERAHRHLTRCAAPSE